MTKVFAAVFLIVFFCFTVNISLYSQVKDSARIVKEKYKDRRPRNAALMSTLVPGLGQIYNKKYWKAPIVWAAMGTDIYFLISNRNEYVELRDAYSTRLKYRKAEANNDPLPPPDIYFSNPDYTDANLKLNRDNFRRYTELNILLLVGIYALNIIDAYVDAHLKEFDVKESLTIGIQPSIQMANYNKVQTGLTVNIKFKK